MYLKSLYFLFLSFALGGITAVRAQSVSPDLDSQIPVDSTIRTGTLDNGLTYYIRRNQRPENRVELRLAVNAGSILEKDDQLGLAHFTEHMAFNGTEHYEKNELVSTLQSAGVRFGAHLNAYTSFDETVYMLMLPTADTTLEDGLQILQDWAQGITFEEEEIDKERGVVIEEWRIGQGAQQRMRDEYLPVLLSDSRYAQRLPIGTKEVLEDFDYATLRQFYQDWYRPDLMAVVAVGDINVDSMEAQIKQYFGELENPNQPRERTAYDIPNHDDTKVVVVADPEATFNQLGLYYKSNQDPEAEETLRDYRQSVLESTFTGMLNDRLGELTQSADPPFLNAGTYYGDVVRAKEAFQAYAIVPEGGIERGLKTLVEQQEKVRQFGFTQTELDRYKRQLLTVYERAYNEREKTESKGYAGEYVRNFLEDEPIPGIAFEYQFMQQYLPEVTLDEINALADRWMREENRVVVVMAPEKEGVTVPTEDQVRQYLQEATDTEVTAYEEEAVAESLMDTPPAAGEITAEKTLDSLGVTELTFGNGVRAVLKPTDFKADEILMLASSPGGHSLYDLDTYYSATNADNVIRQSGVSELSLVALDKFLADKNAGVRPYIGELKEGFSGNATPRDLETLLQLTNLYFTQPRLDSASFQSYITKNKAIYQDLLSNPQYYYQDRRSRILSQNNPRGGGYPTVEDWDKVKLDEVDSVYRDRFADASDFTFFFVGNFEVDSLKPLLATYLGSLPSTNREETWKDIGVRPPSGAVEEDVFKGNDPKSMVSLTFTGEMDYDREEAFELNALIQALNIKLIEEIREKRSGVYGISARGSATKYPYEHYTISVGFPCAPENVDTLTQAVYDEIKKLQASGPTQADLQKVKETLRREIETNLKENGYWLRTLEEAYFNGDDLNEIVDYEEAVNALSVTELKALANKYFDVDEAIEVVLYPEEAVETSEPAPTNEGQ
ncbi:MAG: insulinase family protein [Tunicatimonas sp.]